MSDAAVVSIDDDGRAVYRASGIYSCINALLMHRLGYEGEGPPAWLQERFKAGHDHEPLILEKMSSWDYSISNEQAEIEIPVGSTALIRGHIDGLNTSDKFKISSFDGVAEPQGSSWFTPGIEGYASIVDAKAFSQSTFEKWVKGAFKAFPYYLWQQAVYMYALDANGIVMAVKNKNTDKLLCDYYSREWVEGKLSLSTIIGRVLEVEKLATEQGEGALFEQECSPKMWPCPFRKFHEDESDVPEVTDFDEAEMARLVGLYRDHQQTAKKAEESRKRIGGQIVDLLGAAEATARLGESVVSSYYHVTSSPDWIAIAERLGETVDDTQEMFTKKSKSSKLSARVTVPKKKGNSNGPTATE